MEDNENINKEPDVSTNSWIFVEKGDTEQTAKCLNEGVQELVEDDLGSSSCDSDGISVISETECFLHDDCTCLPKITSDEEETDATTLNDDQANLDKNETNTEITEKTDVPLETITTITSKQVNNNNSPANINNNAPNTSVLTFASTVAGVCIFITYLISNYNTATKTDVTIEDFDDMYDMHLWANYDDNETCDLNNDLIELNTDINNLVKSYDVIKQQSDTNLPVVATKNEKAIYQNQNVNKEKYANKRDKHISRNSNNINNLNNKKVKTKNKSTDNQKNPQKIQTEYLKQQENYLKKKEKYLTKREKYLKKIEKHILYLEARFRKLFNKMKRNDKNQNQKKQLKGNATGEWYEKLSFGRSEIRHKEKLSDWMFERSKMRNKLRDKADWYFSRANGREEYRSSENIRSGKRNYFKTYRY